MQNLKVQIFFAFVLVWTSVMIMVEGHVFIIGLVSFGASLVLLLSLLFSFKKTSLSVQQVQKTMNDKEEPKNDIVQSNNVDLEIASKDYASDEEFGREVFKALAQQTELGIGFMYKIEGDSSSIKSHFAVPDDYEILLGSNENEGFIEQVVSDKKMLEISDIPSDFPFVFSGLGMSCPATILFVPIIKQNTCIYVFELGFLKANKPEVNQAITETIAKLNIPNYE